MPSPSPNHFLEALILLPALALLPGCCNSGEPVPASPAAPEAPIASAIPAPAPAAQPAPPAVSPPATAPPAPTEPDPAEGYSSSRETLGPLRLGLTAEQLRQTPALGPPTAVTPPELWGADGMYHRSWKYPALGLNLGLVSEQAESAATLESIQATGPCPFRTGRGVGIGSSREEVLQAYGRFEDREAGEEGRIVIGSVYDGLILELKDGKVSGLFLGAAAE